MASPGVYPVNLDINGRRCLVVGGGVVAARKVAALLLSGAVVRVVSPDCCPKIRRLADEGRIEWYERTFKDDDLDGAFLVFAATNSGDAQRRVADLARQRGILVNSAENPELSTFFVPARVSRDDFLLTVSTGGASPALSALVKRKLALEFGPEYGQLVALMGVVRKRVVGPGRHPEDNRKLFHAILETPVLDRIRERDWMGLRELLQAVLPVGIDCSALVDRLAAGNEGSRNETR